MHDWTLLSVFVNWINAELVILLKDSHSEDQKILVEDFSRLVIPKQNEWGKSVSINKVSETLSNDGQNSVLEIEIQSGDVIYIEAKFIRLPISQ